MLENKNTYVQKLFRMSRDLKGLNIILSESGYQASIINCNLSKILVTFSMSRNPFTENVIWYSSKNVIKAN